ncbi:uncharacterized protein LY89DRAFT_682955 [Mollisia scopiformis]|uniref:Uncharacterized protein n=1 Tax=Mollisia scopiformis TaxID=149040 RepID=A0A194XJ72_MOLSC|nr:uncharacterized protein LY89DRAFT_682955 [Mollisia scopiformis]KUJ20174.1 hypothetical protein LY89DRAFT_682955 [Mollisia scopiformis]
MYDQELPCLPMASRREIVEHFWGIGADANVRKKLFDDDSYFEYFEQQCRIARQHDHPENRVCTQSNIFDIVWQFKSGVDRETIKTNLSSKVDGIGENSSFAVNYAIDLTVRLWLMVHIGDVQRGITGQTALLWRGGSLKDCVAGHFQHQRILTDLVRFERVFNACNIDRVANVTIRWTPNLVDHLKFIEDGKKPILNIFHHAAFLNYHRESDFFPSGFIDETIRTLALLLPAHDSDSRKWFRKQQAKLPLDPGAVRCGQLKLEERQINHFNFWHDRLVILKQYFDDSKPRTIKQWYYDDRHRVSWFWVAILLVVCTLLFGFIQCVEGGWQIWKAYHP